MLLRHDGKIDVVQSVNAVIMGRELFSILDGGNVFQIDNAPVVVGNGDIVPDFVTADSITVAF